MSVQLRIEDGFPNWWDSLAIWVVPGSDPLGTPGIPAVGQTSYLWARVDNQGESAVSQAQIDFWIANPSLQLRKSVSRFIGSAFVDIAAGGTEDVLCLTPWKVELVNGGHECVIATARSGADPLTPAPVDPDVLDPPTYRQVAQRNLNVLTVTPDMLKVLTIGVHAGARAGRTPTVELQLGGEIGKDVLKRLGVRASRPASGEEMVAGLSRRPGCNGRVPEERRLQIDLAPGMSAPVYVTIRAGKSLKKEQYCLLRLTEHVDDRLVGGITFVVVSETKGR